MLVEIGLLIATDVSLCRFLGNQDYQDYLVGSSSQDLDVIISSDDYVETMDGTGNSTADIAGEYKCFNNKTVLWPSYTENETLLNSSEVSTYLVRISS